MNRSVIKTAALLGALAVALGAFGAHGLKAKLDSTDLQVYQTGVTYQFYHVLALLAVGLLMGANENKFLRWAANLFVTGIILFSGSLYLITYFKLAQSELPRFIGPVTPIGGLMFIAGWIFLFIGVSRRSA